MNVSVGHPIQEISYLYYDVGLSGDPGGVYHITSLKPLNEKEEPEMSGVSPKAFTSDLYIMFDAATMPSRVYLLRIIRLAGISTIGDCGVQPPGIPGRQKTPVS